MIDFGEFMVDYSEHAKRIFKNNKSLFVVDADKDEMWNTYLESYPPEYNEIFRTRREMDCSCCRSFIKNFGNVVVIENNKLVSFWDFRTGDYGYDQMLEAMESFVKSHAIRDVFVTKDSSVGTPTSRELVDSNVHVWNHFFVNIPKDVYYSSSRSVAEIMGMYRDVRNVFKRSLEEISIDAVQEVLDLISENLLYRGEEWNPVLEKFLKLQKEYKKLKSTEERENFSWINSIEAGVAVAKIKNHSIGNLLTDITDGVDTDEAIRKYEVIVAPSNYKRPKAIFTAKMIDAAQKTLESLGLINSLGRRHAHISDITVNDVLWANRNAKKAMKTGLSVFDDMKDDVIVNPKKFENVKGVSIDSFLETLSSVKSFEILVENRNEGNFFSLVAPINNNSPSLFKWDNGFSWAYNGNMADSMKQRVKSAGGRVDGVLRFSIQWNTNRDNQNDYDAHCVEPNGNEIFFPNKGRTHNSSGILDVDIIHPGNSVAVENITWSDRKRMKTGKYLFFVHNYSHNGGRTGFDAEIEFDGEVYEFSHHRDVKNGEKVAVAEVFLNSQHDFTIKPILQHATSNRLIWNVPTNKFTPVSVVMFSPNHWDGEKGIGNKHYFFVLPNCVNETNPNGFYNEYLKEDLLEHKKVFEALGSRMKVEDSESQLSGIGFSSTKRDYVIAKIDGVITKIIF